MLPGAGKLRIEGNGSAMNVGAKWGNDIVPRKARRTPGHEIIAGFGAALIGRQARESLLHCIGIENT